MDPDSYSTKEKDSNKSYPSVFHAIPPKEIKPTVRDALKSLLFSHFHHSRENVGFLTERQSLLVLTSSGLSDACADHGLSYIYFRSIHTLVFSPLAAGRLRISIDCYVDFFLPRFSMELSKTMKSDKFNLKGVLSLLLNQMVESSKADFCGLRDKLVVTCIMANRQLFGISGYHSGSSGSSLKSRGNR
ncbi:hypothetical protein FBUS_00311 [Fasciolopsis buskii]|uniref:Uncharacterized protein n=1 Tax=Fasciolopsis buskii TaxID=27845 RepID=A0A8E0S134_9TREM|nr:hypothetical protein FBUS_00311 [Fasciolopsis buski]